jgi:hypothetical protein
MSESTPNPHLLTESQLMAWLGYKRRADLEARLRELRIPYVYGKGGAIATALAAVNSTLVGRTDTYEEPIEFV